MISIIVVASVAMVALLGVCLVFLVKASATKNGELVRVSGKGEVLAELSILESKTASSEQKIRAFDTMIQKNYSVVAVNTNSGDRYNDRKQTKRFCEKLTPELIEKINLFEDNRLEIESVEVSKLETRA